MLVCTYFLSNLVIAIFLKNWLDLQDKITDKNLLGLENKKENEQKEYIYLMDQTASRK